MAAKSTTATPGTPRKSRTRSAQAYVAQLNGEDKPIIIIAATQKAALASIITLRPAAQRDLIDAGRHSHRVIDDTTDSKKPATLTAVGDAA